MAGPNIYGCRMISSIDISEELAILQAIPDSPFVVIFGLVMKKR